MVRLNIFCAPDSVRHYGRKIKMLTFECDYNEGAHPKVLDALIASNMIQLPGYGEDSFTESARNKIRKICNTPDADVYFLTGGTQTNQFVIDTTLKSYEGVVSAVTGHVGCHEAGAIEYTGHKVLTVPGHQGKMHADELKNFCEIFYGDESHEHMVFPGMVYISYPTEYGTIYSKNELLEIKEVCNEYDMPLFIDGARLGYGLMSKMSDVTIEDIASIADVFYIGGTKVGALCGEALVYPKGNAPEHMQAHLKQHGALLAKGRLNSVQFDALFTDNLYFDIAANAINMAERLKSIFSSRGYEFFIDSPTNQQFVIADNDTLTEIGRQVRYTFWEKYDDTHTVVRFATNWSTSDDKLDELERILDSVK